MEGSEDTLLPLQEAARFLGVSRSSLLRLEADGRIAPFRTAGGHRRYERAALQALRVDLTQRFGGSGASHGAPALPEAILEAPSAPAGRLNATVSRIGAALLVERDTEVMLGQATTAACFITGASLSAFFELDEALQVQHQVSPGARGELLQPFVEMLLGGPLGEGRAERIDDVRNDPRWPSGAGQADVCALLAVPVCRNGLEPGVLCGVLIVAHPVPARFDEREEDLLGALAIQIGVALENARMYGEVSRRNTMLTVLNQVSSMLVVEQDIETALRRILQACHRVTGATAVTLLYRSAHGHNLHLCLDACSDLLSDPALFALVDQTLAGKRIHLGDVRSVLDNSPPASAVRSFLSVPLCAESGAFKGGIFLGHDNVGLFDETHAELARALAAQAIVALEKMLAADENAEIRRELEGIFHGIADPLTVLDQNLTIVECNDGLLHRLGKEREEVVGQNYFQALVGNVAEGLWNGEEGLWNVAHKVFQTGEPCTARVPMITGEGARLLMDVSAYPVRDARGNVAKVVEYAKEVTAEVKLQLALLDRNEELNAATENLARQAEELDLLNQQLQEKCDELARIAVTDVMTGLPNHRAFQENLMREIRRAQRQNTALVLLLLDVDYFKSYNDAYGHPAGDEVLRHVGALLSTAIRGMDMAARYGGEEFAVVLPNANKKEALVVAERIRASIVAHRFPKRPVTVSVGLAAYPEDGKDKDALICMADQALYAAKQGGRNTTRAWPVALVLDRAA